MTRSPAKRSSSMMRCTCRSMVLTALVPLSLQPLLRPRVPVWELDPEGFDRTTRPDDMPDRAPKADRKKQVKLSGSRWTCSNSRKATWFGKNPRASVWSGDEEDYLPCPPWFKKRKMVKYWTSTTRRGLPQGLFNAAGEWSLEKNAKYPFTVVHGAKLLVDPTAGIIYYDDRASENGVDAPRQRGPEHCHHHPLAPFGRSTAWQRSKWRREAPLAQLHGQQTGCPLQSGHFNDFITTGRLRAAIHAALANAPGKTLPSSTSQKLLPRN